MFASCADPGIFIRGGPSQSDKKSYDAFFFSPQSFFKVPERVQLFAGRGGGGGGGGCPIASFL